MTLFDPHICIPGIVGSPVSVTKVNLLTAGRVAVLELGDLHHATVQTQLLLQCSHVGRTLGTSPELKYASKMLLMLLTNSLVTLTS